jgi:hypothetical protein
MIDLVIGYKRNARGKTVSDQERTNIFSCIWTAMDDYTY